MKKSMGQRLSVTLLLMMLAVMGCSSEAKFVQNDVYQSVVDLEQGFQFSDQQSKDLDDLMASLFGTPDDPHLPLIEGVDFQGLFTSKSLAMAGGAVGSDQEGSPRGLYREHCAHCHGVTGDGQGPTAEFLNPYPRDYRPGIFKFKSTPKGRKPTHDDLRRIVVNGIPGTAMPSFKLLPEDELSALIDYVRYLAIRGEVERSLMIVAADELEPGDRLVDLTASADDLSDRLSIAKDEVGLVVEKWNDATNWVREIPAHPDWDMQESIKIGRDLFHGAGQCIKCHGDTALGDGQKTDYDDWNKEVKKLADAIANAPGENGRFRSVVNTALPLRNIHPRNLRQGVYRGGHRPIDLYWRITNSIDGTPMPGLTLRGADEPEKAGTFSPDQVWHLIDYVRSLPYDSLSESGSHLPQNQRERL